MLTEMRFYAKIKLHEKGYGCKGGEFHIALKVNMAL